MISCVLARSTELEWQPSSLFVRCESAGEVLQSSGVGINDVTMASLFRRCQSGTPRSRLTMEELIARCRRGGVVPILKTSCASLKWTSRAR